jgi:hypothetical protein
MISLPQVIMTSDALWTPTKYDDHDALHERFHQIPTTPIDYTDDFYDLKGDVTTNHTRITPPIDLISSPDDPDFFESALPPVLDTTFDSPLTLTCAMVQKHRTPSLLVWFLTSVPSLRSISISLSIFILTPPTRPIPTPLNDVADG